MLKNKLKDELISSMKEKNQLRVSTLRMINASIKDLEISQRKNNKTDDASDSDIIGILVKMFENVPFSLSKVDLDAKFCLIYSP